MFPDSQPELGPVVLQQSATSECLSELGGIFFKHRWSHDKVNNTYWGSNLFLFPIKRPLFDMKKQTEGLRKKKKIAVIKQNKGDDVYLAYLRWINHTEGANLYLLPLN